VGEERELQNVRVENRCQCTTPGQIQPFLDKLGDLPFPWILEMDPPSGGSVEREQGT